MKSQSNNTPIRRIDLAPYYVVPLQQHAGQAGDLIVKTGEKVLKGQPLTQYHGGGRVLPVHAPTSGTIVAIEPRTIAHPSGLSDLCVVIEPDGNDTWVEREQIEDYHLLTPEQLIAKIRAAGIAGLGGAGFPTAAKLTGGANLIKLLIINAAECEPYITADDRLMQDRADEIIEGIRICAIFCALSRSSLVLRITRVWLSKACVKALMAAKIFNCALFQRNIRLVVPSNSSRSSQGWKCLKANTPQRSVC